MKLSPTEKAVSSHNEERGNLQMHTNKLSRRRFIKAAVISAATVKAAGTAALSLAEDKKSGVNPLPRWRGDCGE